MPECIQSWAAEYQARGLGLCRIRPGEKRPGYPNWTRSSLSPEDFRPDDNIGFLAGRLSDDLVCVDIDCKKALAEADHYLPATGMEEGRPGKPRSHRWYRVTHIPPEWTAVCAGGIGGPQTIQFARGVGDMVVEFRGTGSQAVVPPSIWTSRDGNNRERRVWHSFGDPAVLGCMELLEAVARFAEAFGGRNSRWEQRAQPSRTGQGRRPSKRCTTPERLPLPSGEVAQRARAYLGKVPPAIEGQGGDRQTFYAACRLILDFDLSVEQALPLLMEWNQDCEPRWTPEELLHKLEAADALDEPRGDKLRPRSRAIEVNVSPGDREVVVGVDCVAEGTSYVNLGPDLWAGLIKNGSDFVLVPELDAVDWNGKVITLVPPSTVETNKNVVMDEYRLARLLRERGATVECLRLKSPNGRRVTLAGAEEIEVITPPLTDREARSAAQTASLCACEQDAVRRSLPRNKPSPTLDRAVNWLKERNAEEVTRELVKKAKRKGWSESLLRRAMRRLKEESREAVIR